MLPETGTRFTCIPDLKTQRLPERPNPSQSPHHALIFDRVRRPSADGDRLRFLTGMPVDPVAWTDASTASSGASAIFSTACEAALQMQLFFFGC